MTYYSREILEQYLKDTRLNKILDIIDETEPYLTEGKTVPANIKVRFCRDCPYFISDYIPDEVGRYSGWCEWRSEGEDGWHYDVMEDSFCNEDDIVDVYQFSILFIYHILCNL